MENQNYLSFNKYPKVFPREVLYPTWLSDLEKLNLEESVLCYGKGKSYGDVCLNKDGILIDTTNLNHIISFNNDNGKIKCEAGITLKEILEFSVPKGWFLPVTPGTKFITLGGAVANDVHGKNHHTAGTFGLHVTEIELLKSDGISYKCNSENNKELFAATIGGLGLTGFIKTVEFQLISIETPFMYVENIKFDNLDAFFDLNKESENLFPYTVSWVDCTTKGKNMGKGI